MIYVSLENQNYPFLYPSLYVNFNVNSAAVNLAGRLAGQATSDLEIVQLIYDYITTNISFDLDFANAVHSGIVLEATSKNLLIVIASEAKQSKFLVMQSISGLLRRCAPRNDG